MAVSVRRATPDLAGLLTDLAYEAKRHWGYPESLMALWKDSLTLAADFISENPVYTAETDKSILRFYAVVQKDDVASLEHFWIRPEVMGKGIGRILFLHAVRVAKKAECRSLEIVSDPNAEGFYIRMGARRVGFAPSIPEDRQLPKLEYAL